MGKTITEKDMEQRESSIKHEFAFYVENISSIRNSLSFGSELRINNPDICHRIEHVIRLQPDDMCVLFDQQHNIQVQFISIDKKKYLNGIFHAKNHNETISPHITCLLPLLKKENFENAIYALTELGVQEIQPVITAKSLNYHMDGKKRQRFQKIIIAAAEQSKHFAFPALQNDITFDSLFEQQTQPPTIYFDPEGENAEKIVNAIKQEKIKEITVMIGPEGDLTTAEKTLLQQHGTRFCKLTPTVLRSFQAVTVGVGLIRSLLSQ